MTMLRLHVIEEVILFLGKMRRNGSMEFQLMRTHIGYFVRYIALRVISKWIGNDIKRTSNIYPHYNLAYWQLHYSAILRDAWYVYCEKDFTPRH